ncbi:hypothetical protein PSEUBRA_001006 [Kalmanozyma brasiliensis GHG001]|uniref:uncharacterized protein n=1 Tax=Kalmanozyma brasiliensis (strain GHG001) TaxID=1365824 RepID=UPI001CE7A670|nr:uncharacterized protein PSEUBRA_001006 [Kalmanozyma brasiliensis GHG001]KAF6766876.1 hypothetical protein PSEUBRA_001006 [Kalmanozyma brasiliensis GHG001]
MFQTAPSPGRTGPQPSAYGFATPVRTPSTSYHNNAAYSQALTPAESKGVRFQNQPLPPQVQQPSQPQQQQQQSSSALSTTTTPNRSPYYNAVSAPAPAQAQTPSRTAVTTSSAAPSATPSNKISGTRAVVASTAGASGNSESSIALARRIKWNLGALGLLWIVPAFSTRPRDVYWTALDQIYLHVGGETDELVDGIVGWILWAVSVILFFNAVEAGVQMSRASPPTSAPQQIQEAPKTDSKMGPVLGMHSPQVAKSINFVAASRLKGSPKTRTSTIGAGSPISRSSPQRSSPSGGSPTAPTDYSQFSPSLRRTSSPLPSPSSGGGFGSSSSRMGTPTQTGADYAMGLGAGASSSPLAAFRARHASRGSVSPSSIRARSITPSVSGGLAETSLSFDDASDDVDGGQTFLGDESFEVDRALRNLRSSLGGVSSTPAPSFR